MTSQESFIWLQYAQLYENEQKETKKSLIETTAEVLYLYFNGVLTH